ncbi:MAG: hypothetical protein AB1657_02905 [Candidatus Micrarchaeota archaeon]
MKEKITEAMVAGWYRDFPNPRLSSSLRIRSLIIVAESGMIAAKDVKGSGISFLRPSDFGIDWKLSKEARLLHSPSKGVDYIYLLDPGSGKIIRLDLYFEGDYFGFYSRDYTLPFALSKAFCASASGENLLVVDSGNKKYAFMNEKGERVSASLEIRECLGCAVLGPEGGIACDEGRLFTFLGGRRAEISLDEITEQKFRSPIFGMGRSKNYSWAAVKDKEWDFSILICVSGEECFSYTRFPVIALKGRAPL